MTRSLAISTTFLATLLLAACAVPYNLRIRVSDDAVVALKPGQTALLTNQGSLRYVRLVTDSRCAPDVQCIWAGDAVIALHWMPASGKSTDLELHSNPASGPNHADLDGRRITFTFLSRQAAEASFQVTISP